MKMEKNNFNQTPSIIAGIFIFSVTAPFIGGNIYSVTPAIIYVYFEGFIPALIAGILFALATINIFKKRGNIKSSTPIPSGTLLGAAIGTTTAMTYFILKTHLVDVAILMSLCGCLGGAISGVISRKAMASIYFR